MLFLYKHCASQIIEGSTFLYKHCVSQILEGSTFLYKHCVSQILEGSTSPYEHCVLFGRSATIRKVELQGWQTGAHYCTVAILMCILSDSRRYRLHLLLSINIMIEAFVKQCKTQPGRTRSQVNEKLLLDYLCTPTVSPKTTTDPKKDQLSEPNFVFVVLLRVCIVVLLEQYDRACSTR